MLDSEENNVLETKHFKLWFQNGILHVKYQPQLIVTIDIAKQIVAARLKFVKGVEYASLVDLRNIKKVDYASMKYWASEEAYECVSKVAIFSDKRISKILINFWFKVDKPHKPTKYFTELGEAYLFLKPIYLN